MASNPVFRKAAKLLDEFGIERLAELHLAGLGYRELAELLGVSHHMIYKWMRKREGYRAIMDQARKDRADLLADETLTLADGAGPDPADVQKAKLQIEARQWLAVRFNPDKYANRKARDINVNINQLHLDALRQIRAEELEAPDEADYEVLPPTSEDLDPERGLPPATPDEHSLDIHSSRLEPTS